MEQSYETRGCQISQGMHSSHRKAVTESEESFLKLRHFKTCPCGHVWEILIHYKQ